jgi:hypothetical protein
MPGVQERAGAASREFVNTFKLGTATTKECARVVFDSTSGDFAKINSALHAVLVPLVTLPLAVEEAVRAFIIPSDKKV